MRAFLTFTCVVACAMGHALSAAPSASRLNVLFLVSDDLPANADLVAKLTIQWQAGWKGAAAPKRP